MELWDRISEHLMSLLYILLPPPPTHYGQLLSSQTQDVVLNPVQFPSAANLYSGVSFGDLGTGACQRHKYITFFLRGTHIFNDVSFFYKSPCDYRVCQERTRNILVLKNIISVYRENYFKNIFLYIKNQVLI